MEYANHTKGARAIHLMAGGHVLVEPGASVFVEEHKIKRLAPGLTKVEEGLPPIPEGLAAIVSDLPSSAAQFEPSPAFDAAVANLADVASKFAAPSTEDIKAVRVEYEAKMGKKPFPGWPIEELRRRMGDA